MAESERGADPEVLHRPHGPIEDDVTTTPESAAPADVMPADAATAHAATTEAATAHAATTEAATDSGPEVRPPSPRRQLPVLLVAALLAFVVDLVTKLLAVAQLSDRAPVQVVPKVLDLQLTRNPGAAFGLAGGATIISTVVAAAVVVFIVATARRLRSRGWAVALGLLLGGAVGNLGDRLFRDPAPLRGHVVDWIHLTHWPIFNVADTCIVVGGFLAVLLSLRGRRLDGTVETHS